MDGGGSCAVHASVLADLTPVARIDIRVTLQAMYTLYVRLCDATGYVHFACLLAACLACIRGVCIMHTCDATGYVHSTLLRVV